jgi:hypothetical protein
LARGRLATHGEERLAGAWSADLGVHEVELGFSNELGNDWTLPWWMHSHPSHTSLRFGTQNTGKPAAAAPRDPSGYGPNPLNPVEFAMVLPEHGPGYPLWTVAHG